MSVRFTDFYCKEVICVSDGRRLGFVRDARVELPAGNLTALIVPGPGRCFGLFGRRDEYVIPWGCICRMGPDIILVDIDPNACRCPRPRHPFLP